jgi:hypothetical protein
VAVSEQVYRHLQRAAREVGIAADALRGSDTRDLQQKVASLLAQIQDAEQATRRYGRREAMLADERAWRERGESRKAKVTDVK